MTTRGGTGVGAQVWIGRVITGLVGLVFLASSVMKLIGPEGMEEGLAHIGLPESLVVPIAILELICVVLYLTPPTAVLGGILLTGYAGGAILTHLRVGDPFVIPAVLGLAAWLGLYLREERLRELLPLRRAGSRSG
jgi:hypothetical protein